MKLSITQNRFTTGEIGPALIMRKDLEPYAGAVLKLWNMDPEEQGPIASRPGTIFVNSVDQPTEAPVILLPFSFAVGASVLLEVGNKYIKFYVGGQLIVDPDDLTKPLILDIPYLSSDLAELSYAQHGDAIYLTHPNYAPRKLLRHQNDSWELLRLDLDNGPFHPVNLNELDQILLISGGEAIADDTVFEFMDITSTPQPGFLLSCQKPASTVDDGQVAVFIVSAVDEANSQVTAVLMHGAFDTVWWAEEFRTGWRAGVFPKSEDVSSTGRIQLGRERYDLQPDGSYTYNGAAVAVQRDAATEAASIQVPYEIAIGLFVTTLMDMGLDINGNRYWDTTNEYGIIGAGRDDTGLYNWGGVLTIKYDMALARYVLYAVAAAYKWFSDVEYFNTDQIIGLFDPSVTEYDVPLVQIADGRFNSLYGYAHDPGAPDEFPVYGTKCIDVVVPGQVGFPALVYVFQERLILARSKDAHSTLWFSRSSAPEDFGPTNAQGEVVDDSAISYAISGQDGANAIEWIAESGFLIVGTSGAEFVVRTSNRSAPITPKDISFIQQSAIGSATGQRPVIAGSQIVFIQRQRNKLRALSYNLSTDTFVSDDLTRLHPDILRNGGGALDISFMKEPHPTIMVALADGSAAMLLFAPEEQAVAWSKMDIAQARITSSVVLPAENDTLYTRYMLVKRIVNNVAYRYIERSAEFKQQLDGMKVYEGSLTGTISGLDHLDMEEVTIVVPGRDPVKQVVLAGQVTVSPSVTNAVVGLPFTSEVSMLPVDMVGPEVNSTADKAKRLLHIQASLVDTDTIKIVDSLGGEYELEAPGGEAYTGRLGADIDDDFDIECGEIKFVHEGPHQARILAITRGIEFRE